MYFLRASVALRSVVPVQRYAYVRAYSSQSDSMQQLLLASREGNAEKAELLAKNMQTSRQVYGALAAAHLYNCDFEKAAEYTKLAEKQK
mmetsp:Transcript_8256/g.13880  ORF Transcript_8256/g.13880 Transcript_8256/m.13880 type:complete len:89 (+) Transcript_8256:119-385(+)